MAKKYNNMHMLYSIILQRANKRLFFMLKKIVIMDASRQ